MRPTLGASLCLLSLSSGCWFRLGDGTGSVILTWSMNGGEDCATVGVTEVEVSVGALSVSIPCDDLGGSSIGGTALPRVPPGTQIFTITAVGDVYDPDAGAVRSEETFKSTLAFDVAEESTNITPVVDLQPVDTSGHGGDLVLLWSFGGQTCDQAEVSQVTIVLDGFAGLVDGGFSASGDELTVPCHAGGQDGTRLLGLAQDLYSFPLSANGPAGFPATAYVAAPSAYVTGFTETTEHVDLHSALHESLPGQSISLELVFGFGLDGGGCAQSGVDQIRVQLFQSQVVGPDGPMAGSPTLDAYQSNAVLDELMFCPDGMRPTLTKSTNDRDLGPLPCDPTEIDSGTCPIVSGEYTLLAQGLDVGGRITFELSNYNLSVDQGLTDGVTAGAVSEFGLNLEGGPIPGTVDSTYLIDIPAVPANQ